MVRLHDQGMSTWTADELDLTGSERVLELACGTGRTTDALLARTAEGSVDALEHDPVLLHAAARRHRDALAQGRLSLHPGTLDSLPTAGPVFDRVTGLHAVHQFLEPQPCLAAVLDALEPGGSMGLGMVHRHNVPELWLGRLEAAGQRAYRPGELARHACAVGFADVTEALQPGGPGVLLYGLEPG